MICYMCVLGNAFTASSKLHERNVAAELVLLIGVLYITAIIMKLIDRKQHSHTHKLLGVFLVSAASRIYLLSVMLFFVYVVICYLHRITGLANWKQNQQQ